MMRRQLVVADRAAREVDLEARSSGPRLARAQPARSRCRTTQRSIAWIMPKRSATPRNAPGGISSPSVARACAASSSYWETSLGARGRGSAGSRASSRRSRAPARIRSAQSSAGSTRLAARRPGCRRPRRSRPASLASYIARSASASISSASASAPGSNMRDADAGRHAASAGRRPMARARRSASSRSLGDRRGLVAVGLRQQHGELVAAEARQHVGLAQAAAAAAPATARSSSSPGAWPKRVVDRP